MTYKSLIIQIKSCNYKLFIFNQLDLFESRKDLSNDIQPLLKISITKTDLDITQSVESYPISYTYANVSQKENLFKESGLFVFIIYQKRSNHNFKYFKLTAIYPENINICSLKTETKFYYKTRPYYLKLIVIINKSRNHIYF